MQQTAEEELSELYFLLGEPKVCLETSTDAAAAFLEQAVSDPQNIRDKLLQLLEQASTLHLSRGGTLRTPRRIRHVASCRRRWLLMSTSR